MNLFLLLVTAGLGIATLQPAQALDALGGGGATGRPVFMVGGDWNVAGSRLFSDNSTPRYEGNLLRLHADYQMGDQGFSLGPYLAYTWGELENSGNNASQQEIFDQKSYSGGLKAYWEYFYLYLGYGIHKNKLHSTGTVQRFLNLNGSGPEGGIGLSFTFWSYFVLSIGADASYLTYPANQGGITSKTSHFKYGGTVGLSFVLPSGQPTSRKKTLATPY